MSAPRQKPPRLLAPTEEYSDDSESDNDDLNKTLPANFKFRPHHLTPVAMQSPPTRGSPVRSVAHATRQRGTTIQRRQPVAPSQKPSLSRYKKHRHNLGSSDPAITRNNLLSPEDSFDDDHEYHPSLLKRDSLKLPMRAQSLNYPKSPVSPRISSPSPGDFPGGSPRTWSPSTVATNFERFTAGRRSEMGRRWSVVSLASSGYTTGATDSPASLSSFPSQEQIHQLPTTPTMDDFRLLSRHFRSDSASSVVITDEDGVPIVSRPRARSLSPERSRREILLDLDATHNIFKNKFPRAKEEMEEKLQDFLTKYSDSKFEFSDSTMNFGRHQILECARELLEKSQQGALGKDSFIQISDNLEQTLADVKERRESEPEKLNHLVKKLLIIIGRVARLLEIMDFDPEDFSMTISEGQLDRTQVAELMSSSHTPYILNRLNVSLAGERTEEDAARPRTTSVTLEKSNSSCSDQHPSKHDFDVIKIISNGAYGAVYLVRHKGSRKRFAMKKVSKHRMVMKKQVQQVFYERDILTFAENPFVVGLWCTFQTKRHLYMVMEYVEGGDVATLIKNVGCLPLEMGRMYFSETVLALEYIHSYGIIHRDLKPDNLLITSEGHVKLTDFGLSKIGLVNYAAHVLEDAWSSRDRQFHDVEVYGTPDYIAPEVILGQGYGFPVDWWSMGVILYEMLIGATPFWGTTVQEMFEKITNANLQINWPEEDEDDIPEEAKGIVEELLCHDPCTRLGSTAMGGINGVKEHCFFDEIDWRALLRQKAEFVPQLQGEEDTSYFDTRSDRYSHEFVSDEEDGGEDDSYQNQFENFNSTAPRFSHLLDELQTSFDENTLAHQQTHVVVAAPHHRNILEPKHEKRDSGIAGIDETTAEGGGGIKILEERKQPVLLSPEERSRPLSHQVLKEGGEDSEGGEDGEESGDTEEEAEGLVTRIDELSEDEEEEDPSVTPEGRASAEGERVLSLDPSSSSSSSLHHPLRSPVSPGSVTSPPATPLLREPANEMPLLSPVSQSSAARRRLARVEDFSKLSINQTGLDIMVSPPTPGLMDSSSSSGAGENSPVRSPRNSMVSSPITIRRGSKGYGVILKSIRVYIGDTNDYRIHHIVSSVDKKSQAWDAGLRSEYLVTHINGESITGLQHVQVMTLMLDKKNTNLSFSTIPLDETSIRKDKRKRAPSLGHRVGKLFRHRSSGSGKIKKRPSFFTKWKKERSAKAALENSGHSSSGTPSPKLPSSPSRSESFKDRMTRMIKPGDRRRKQTPVSPLARSTSPVALSHVITPNSSPPGSMQNLTGGTPPNSPPTQTRRPERHSMIVDSQLLLHKKSMSACELTPPLPTKAMTSPQTSPLLKRAMSPSAKRGRAVQKAVTIPRATHKPKKIPVAAKKRATAAIEETVTQL